MSGGYTHITLAQLAIEEACFKREGLLHDDAKHALGNWKKFCIVGAVAPDYPYLDIMDSNSCAWADVMHKRHAVALLRNGVAKIRDMADVNVRQKCIAWLFGFASHVATDGTIHPVVNLKVGPYEQNKTEHRRCEMSQDVYAHSRLNLGALEFNQQISTNVADTSDADNPDRMDPDVAQLWQDLLTGVYSGSGSATSISQDTRLAQCHAPYDEDRRKRQRAVPFCPPRGCSSGPGLSGRCRNPIYPGT